MRRSLLHETLNTLKKLIGSCPVDDANNIGCDGTVLKTGKANLGLLYKDMPSLEEAVANFDVSTTDLKSIIHRQVYLLSLLFLSLLSLLSTLLLLLSFYACYFLKLLGDSMLPAAQT